MSIGVPPPAAVLVPPVTVVGGVEDAAGFVSPVRSGRAFTPSGVGGSTSVDCDATPPEPTESPLPGELRRSGPVPLAFVAVAGTHGSFAGRWLFHTVYPVAPAAPMAA